jgi:hypothetical protein
VLVFGTVKDLVAGSGIQFADRGMHTLKGVRRRRSLAPRPTGESRRRPTRAGWPG